LKNGKLRKVEHSITQNVNYIIGDLVVLDEKLEHRWWQCFLHDTQEFALLRANNGSIGQVDDGLLKLAYN